MQADLSAMGEPPRPDADSLVQALLPRCTFPADPAPIACAVSGGPDSLALLVLACATGYPVTAYHVDHGLRKGSADEAGVVARAAGALGAGFVALHVSPAPGPNLEARAREARFAVLPAGVATGHTMDDQAETVIVNLLRGAGIAGLAGMRGGPRHPLLALRRSETHALCDAMGLDPVTDPTNTDARHLRNRVRHELLPLMCEIARRDLVPVLARQAALMAADEDELARAAGGVDTTDVAALAALPEALARRAVRNRLQSGGPHPPSLAEVERVLAVVAGLAPATEVSRGRRIERIGARVAWPSA